MRNDCMGYLALILHLFMALNQIPKLELTITFTKSRTTNFGIKIVNVCNKQIVGGLPKYKSGLFFQLIIFYQKFKKSVYKEKQVK